MARKRTATLLYSTEEVLTVLEFFAVGDLSTAVLLRAVKGGVNLPQTNISAIFKVHLSLFLIAQFFITQLTLPHKKQIYNVYISQVFENVDNEKKSFLHRFFYNNFTLFWCGLWYDKHIKTGEAKRRYWL